jgi:hypothetical protein
MIPSNDNVAIRLQLKKGEPFGMQMAIGPISHDHRKSFRPFESS